MLGMIMIVVMTIMLWIVLVGSHQEQLGIDTEQQRWVDTSPSDTLDLRGGFVQREEMVHHDVELTFCDLSDRNFIQLDGSFTFGSAFWTHMFPFILKMNRSRKVGEIG